MSQGSKHGKLLILERHNKKSWKCLCDCGNEVVLFDSQLSNGRTSCGCSRPRNLTNKEQAINILWSRYINTSEKRNIEFSISKEKFSELVFSNCSICGALPATPVKLRNQELALYNGIDRVDSDKPYEENNCAPCCWICNRAKGDLSIEQFRQWIAIVYRYQYKKVTDKTPGQMIDELTTTVIKCFMAQEDIMKGEPDTPKTLDAAKRAQELNAKRTKLMRSIDFLLDFGEDTPTPKTYDK